MAQVADKGKQAYSYKVKIFADRCKGCGLCLIYCPTKHLQISSQLNKKGVAFAISKKDSRCIGCGFCFFMCPESCIEVYEKKSEINTHRSCSK